MVHLDPGTSHIKINFLEQQQIALELVSLHALIVPDPANEGRRYTKEVQPVSKPPNSQIRQVSMQL